MVTQRLARSGKFDAIIGIGVLIRGAATLRLHRERGHQGPRQCVARLNVPVAFGVLTCDTIDQAIERAGTKAGNKGHEAAMSAIEMVNLYRGIDAWEGEPARGIPAREDERGLAMWILVCATVVDDPVMEWWTASRSRTSATFRLDRGRGQPVVSARTLRGLPSDDATGEHARVVRTLAPSAMPGARGRGH